MSEVTIRTASGNRQVTLEKLQQFVAEGKIRPEMRVVSRDGGATFVTVAEVLGGGPAVPQAANHLHAAPPIPPQMPVAYPLPNTVPIPPQMPMPGPGPMGMPVGQPMQMPARSPGGMLPLLILIAAGAGVLCSLLPQFYVSVSQKLDKESVTIGSGFNMGWKIWWSVVTLTAGLLAVQAILFQLLLKGIDTAANLARWFYLPAFGIMTLIALVGIVLGFMGMSLRYSPDLSSKHWGPYDRMRSDVPEYSVSMLLEQTAKNKNSSEVSVTRIPIGTALALGCGGFGLTLSVMSLLRKPRQGVPPYA